MKFPRHPQRSVPVRYAHLHCALGVAGKETKTTTNRVSEVPNLFQDLISDQQAGGALGHAQLEVGQELLTGQDALLVGAAFLEVIHAVRGVAIETVQAGLQNWVRAIGMQRGMEDG